MDRDRARICHASLQGEGCPYHIYLLLRQYVGVLAVSYDELVACTLFSFSPRILAVLTPCR